MTALPDEKKLNELLRSSRIVSGGFLGNDTRSVNEIILTDSVMLAGLEVDCKSLAKRMKQITARAAEGLGLWVKIDDNLQAKCDEARGMIICPWPHLKKCLKRTTTLRNIHTNSEITWSDLNIHLIEAHGFFEGKGSPFRLEPRELVLLLF